MLDVGCGVCVSGWFGCLLVFYFSVFVFLLVFGVCLCVVFWFLHCMVCFVSMLFGMCILWLLLWCHNKTKSEFGKQGALVLFQCVFFMRCVVSDACVVLCVCFGKRGGFG